MLSFVVVGCVVLVTIVLVRHVAIKSGLVENEIEKVVKSKLSTSKYVTELTRLQEENLVMRNLLKDLVEGETLFAASMASASPTDNLRYRKVRLQAYRETIAEAAYILQNTDNTQNFIQQEKATVERH